MRATAILGPAASEKDLQPFHLPGVELRPAASVDVPAAAALIFGGDGTIHRQLLALASHKIPALIVPMGSGNDFAHALGISTPAHALNAWRKFCAGAGNVREIDLGCILPAGSREPTLFCCVGGAGLDSDANRRANAMPRWLRAHGGYLLAAVAAISSFRPQTFQVEVLPATSPPQSIREAAYMVAFANAPTYGHGMRIAPTAALDDARLNVSFVRGTSKLRMLRLLPKVFSGSHVNLSEVEYFPAERLRVATEPPLDVYADGEYICQTPVEVSVLPRALRVVVP